MTVDYGKAFGLMRTASGQSWQGYTTHTFVEGLRDGTLPNDAFLHYLRQDYVFLMHFSRAWALAVVKADRFEEMQAASATVHTLLDEEIKLHIALCAEVGITEADLQATVERPENMAYTRFVLEAGYSGDFMSLLAALAPCVLGYGEIGARLSATKTSDTYADWIGTYGGDDYQELCKSVGELIESALVHRFGTDYDKLPIWDGLCDTFTKATQLEVGFWDMGMTP